MKTIPFNVELAKKGAKVQTRDGRDVRIICYDRKCSTYPIVALIPNAEGNYENNIVYTIDGAFNKEIKEFDMDLVILVETQTVFINLFYDDKNKLFYLHLEKYLDKNTAETVGKTLTNYVKTIDVEIENYDY